ncbi:MAG: hypothetical protein JW829_05325 [Pirellulales bacterium]|nr:hypothetical protein [Pirellulales bacterium]
MQFNKKTIWSRLWLVGAIAFSMPWMGGCGRNKFAQDEASDLFLEAMQVKESNQNQAIDLLTKVINSKPSTHAYFQRSWLYASQGKESEARSDVSAGLQLNPNSTDLKWLANQLKKPKPNRTLDKLPTTIK